MSMQDSLASLELLCRQWDVLFSSAASLDEAINDKGWVKDQDRSQTKQSVEDYARAQILAPEFAEKSAFINMLSTG